ncbi:MAG: hypothetical protein A2W86_05245 [Bacteroidetes bacterium GWD2_45_23]|nr:MAG: hypothetical protein A2W87_12475 [Bacteroidetes bacterium GWC2_46_850]OFX78270.1 MAG: hypothetical protein A2071_10290 [Bacteroidetes bacterium GWC1_47_7]OFX87579.1 MAG: hypothetical protein A2W86_05245 [Bacteroidetes bacterium GWD2_45_23]HBB01468.1 hypothetical protein [Porphyromonadaceae bacterium]HCC19083.1 hypothetical protein [Porphyromonadaceae bacterium]
MHRLYLLILWLFFILTAFGQGEGNLQTDNGKTTNRGVAYLLDKLDVETAPLSEVQKITDRENQGKALLNYFRSRYNVHHRINRDDRVRSLGNIASQSDFELADDALKHIFVGQPAYPRFFCGEDIDWGSRPVPDNEWVWQLNRMNFWNAMGRTYWHTSDEKYARAWGEQLIDWVSKNPNDEDHRYAWRSIEAGIRGNSWCELYQRFIDSPSFTPEVLTAFLTSLHDHASFLMTKYTTNSNWALMEAEGLAAIAILFPEFKEAPLWREEAFRRFNIEIDKQVYSDGQQRELAMGYHVGCISWFLRSYELARMNEMKDAFPRTYVEKIEKMCEVPMKLCHPDGTVVQFGDAWTGKPGQYKNQFMAWSKLFDRDDFLYMATDGTKGKAPYKTAFALPESGLYSMRSGWDPDAIFLALKCGPNGGGHAQPDNGTFGLYAGGRILMPDAGSYIYSGDPEGRAWFRQTKVHQTITLDDLNSAYAPKLLYWNTNKGLDVLVVENNSYDDLTHRRSLLFIDKRYFVIVDEVYGAATGEVGLHFQLAPGEPAVDKKNFSVQTNFPEGWNVYLQTAHNQNKMQLLEEEGWVSHQYTIKEPRPAFCFNINKTGDNPVIRYVTLLVPYKDRKPDIKVRILNESEKEPISKMNLEITENSSKKMIQYNL